MTDVTMPRLSDTMEEGTIATWLKQPGDQVKRGDVLAQVETDKATMDLTAFESGTLQEILAEPGTTVPIGQPVARIGTGAPPGEATPAAGEGAPAPPGAHRTQPASGAAEDGAEHANGAAGKLRASPMARHIAAEHGIDLSRLHGSGPLGRVIRADVEAALAPADQSPQPAAATVPAQPAPEPTPSAGAEPGGREAQPQPVELDGAERVPLSQMRRTIARRMIESVSTTPHFYLTTTVDATELVALRAQLIAQAEAAGESFKVSLNDLILRAVAVALRRMPEVNVSYAEQELIRHAHVNLGIAVATDRGLMVPVIRDADQKSISQIARETRDLAERARDGKLQPADYRGGTFTVSNLGMFGIDFFTAVINPPEAGILAVGAVVREPAEYQGQIALRERMHLTLSVDHRALDGAVGARFLQLLKKLLEQPLLTV
jgi:pyruvate dehydrogenase E2 component (dihydrolipoamide acetyltransferase)